MEDLSGARPSAADLLCSFPQLPLPSTKNHIQSKDGYFYFKSEETEAASTVSQSQDGGAGTVPLSCLQSLCSLLPVEDFLLHQH